MLRSLFSRRSADPEEAAYRRLANKGYSPASIIDVGAYEGNWTRLAKRCFPQARVLMCEAQPDKSPYLEQVSAQLRGVEFISALLASRSGDIVSFSEMETGSSIYPENSNVVRRVRELTTRTLDEVAADVAGPCFLKIDVQGAELDVLGGGHEVLQRCDLVQLEIAMVDYNRGAPRFLDVISYMDAKGFAPFDLSGWSRPNGMDLVQIDLLFVPTQSGLRRSFFEF